MLSKASTLFHDLIVHFREAEAFVEGAISDLKPCTCVLTKPERRHRGGKNGNGNGNDWERTSRPRGRGPTRGSTAAEAKEKKRPARTTTIVSTPPVKTAKAKKSAPGSSPRGPGRGYYGEHHYVGYGYERGKGDASYGYGFERADAFAIPGLPAASFFSDEARAERRVARGGP